MKDMISNSKRIRKNEKEKGNEPGPIAAKINAEMNGNGGKNHGIKVDHVQKRK